MSIQHEMTKPGTIRRMDYVMAPLCEAGLIALAGLAGWAAHQPLLFASLGPTAYELIETPERKSAKPYNVIVGHVVGIMAAMAAVWVTHAGRAAPVGTAGVPLVRVWTAVIAAGLTVSGTLLAKATQPAALSTTLLIALGIMSGWRNAGIILASVLLMIAVGEPLRRWRERERAAN